MGVSPNIASEEPFMATSTKDRMQEVRQLLAQLPMSARLQVFGEVFRDHPMTGCVAITTEDGTDAGYYVSPARGGPPPVLTPEEEAEYARREATLENSIPLEDFLEELRRMEKGESR
jgi:hypothetical protein